MNRKTDGLLWLEDEQAIKKYHRKSYSSIKPHSTDFALLAEQEILR